MMLPEMALLSLLTVEMIIAGSEFELKRAVEEGSPESRQGHLRISLQRRIVVKGRKIIDVARQGGQVVQGPVLRQTDRGIERPEGFIPEKGDALEPFRPLGE